MTLLVILRPEPGGTKTLADAHAAGLEAVSYPLFEVRPVSWRAPEPDSFDAVLIGSANSMVHGGRGIMPYRDKPAYAVGAATAQAAKAAGLDVVATGSGGMQALFAQLAPGHGRLLRLSGRARVVLAPPPGVSVTERVVYDSISRPMPDDLVRLLTARALAGAVVLLHSAEAARHFAECCTRQRIPRERLRLAALGPRIAAAAGSGWAQVAIADQPDDAALLALAGQLCQNSSMRNTGR